jgi:hypothetical protein
VLKRCFSRLWIKKAGEWLLLLSCARCNRYQNYEKKLFYSTPLPIIFRNKIAFYIFTYRLPMYIYLSHCHVRKDNKKKNLHSLMHSGERKF